MEYKPYPNWTCHKCGDDIGGAGQPGAYTYDDYVYCNPCLHKVDNKYAFTVEVAVAQSKRKKKFTTAL